MTARTGSESEWREWPSMTHASRYRAIAESVARFCPEGRVLDVGCGEAMLLEPSARAAAVARAKYVRFGILHCAPETFEPNDYRWDCIIFNEVLAYARDPLALLSKYARLLRPKGVMIISSDLRPMEAVDRKLARWLRWWRVVVRGRRTTDLMNVLARHGWPIAESKTVPIPGTQQHWTIWTAEPPAGADFHLRP